MQVAATLSCLFHSRLARRALLLVPVSLTANWERELRSWCPTIPVYAYSGPLKRREQRRQQCAARGGILLATYGLVASARGAALFASPAAGARSASEWDALILDEGHRIRNADIALTRAVKRISARFRLLLSGTPIQNDITELWSLMDFACSGRLLGERAAFREQWAQPIQDGYDRSASAAQRHLAQQLTQQLHAVLRPHLLRRDKEEVLRRQRLQESSPSPSPPLLSAPKNDVIVWVFLSEVQVRLYSAFISSPEVKAALNSTRSPFAALSVLKKICDHPRLLHQQMRHCRHLQLSGADEAEAEAEAEGESDAGQPSSTADALLGLRNPAVLLGESRKLRVLLTLLQSHRAGGHRTLVFSQSVRMLDLIAAALTAASEPFPFLRLDGSIRSGDERQRLVERFSASTAAECPLLLLTTGVGGVGLNLTAADRCVIVDPAWNPAVDSQSVDRCYRIGQWRPVLVYRLVTCGTIEEVIYRKQVAKQGLFNAVHNGDAPAGVPELRGGYFTRQELREVFSLRDHRDCVTQRQLVRLHPPSHRRSYPELDEHLAFLSAQSEDVFGLSDHDLLFQDNPTGGSGGATPTSQQSGAADDEEVHLQAREQVAAAATRRHKRANASHDPALTLRCCVVSVLCGPCTVLQAREARQRLLLASPPPASAAPPVGSPPDTACRPRPREADRRTEERASGSGVENAAARRLDSGDDADADEGEEYHQRTGETIAVCERGGSIGSVGERPDCLNETVDDESPGMRPSSPARSVVEPRALRRPAAASVEIPSAGKAADGRGLHLQPTAPSSPSHGAEAVAEDDEGAGTESEESADLPCSHAALATPQFPPSAERRQHSAAHLREARRLIARTAVERHEEDEEEEEQQADRWAAQPSALLALSLDDALRVLDCLLSALALCEGNAALHASVLLLHAHLQLLSSSTLALSTSTR